MMIREIKELFKLGLPIMVGQLGIIILSFADTMMVGRYGTTDLAAASFVNNMFNLVIIFSTGFSYGITPLVGGFYGRGDNRGVGRILRNSLSVNGAMSLILISIMLVLYMNIHRLGQPSELLPLMKPYFLVLLVSLVPVLLFNSFKQFSDGITDTVTPMCILLGGNLLNIFGNWVLIYGKFGFPEMGLLGAGISTLSSRVVMLVVFAMIFLSAKRYKPYRIGFREGRLNRNDAGKLYKLGIPVALQMGMEASSFSLSTVMVGWLGATELAAHQVMLTVSQVGFMMYYGMAAAVAVRASNFNGCSDNKAVRRTVSAGFRIIMSMVIVVAVIMLALKNHIGFMFTDSAEVAMLVSALVIPFVIYQFGDGLQCNYSNALRGISDVKMVTIYAFISYFVVSLPSGYFFGFIMGMGLSGIWLSFPLGLTCAGILFQRRFAKTMALSEKKSASSN